MKSVFTFEEIREVEKKIIENEKVPSIVLMENAGKNSFDIIAREYPDLDDYQIFIVCGKGNNAGDGFTLARHFIINKIPARIICLTDPVELKGDALINYKMLSKETGIFLNFDQFKKGVVVSGKILIIDAILGTGITGQLGTSISQFIEFLNDIKKRNRRLKIASIDVPSGLTSGEQMNPVVDADFTITMGAQKTELLFGAGKENAGTVFAASIGIDECLLDKYNSYKKYFTEAGDIKMLFPKRKKSSHKYSNGKVLIVGGSKGLSGAVAMSCLSALKTGTGGVAAAIPESISTVFNRKLFEVMTVELADTEKGTIQNDQVEKIKKRMEWADVVLLGPGISTDPRTKEFVFDVISNCDKPLVIDADGLNVLSDDLSVLSKKKSGMEIILTPHPGEFAKLAGIDMKEIQLNRFEAARDFVNHYNVNLILKSETSLSCLANGEIYINSSGNEALATAGSGDVLSGIVASLFAQSGDAKTAMLCGNYLHGLCADFYFARTGNKQSATPQDIIQLIPEAVSNVRN
jgi:ADP-dependent NAD(P)H-hydrate dehydratase / NAD(P)H-hydrate epimerase